MLKLLERYEEAMSSYEDAIRLDSTDADLHVSKAQVLICTKKYEEALVACEEAIRLDPNNASAHKEKGYALVQLDHYEDAVSAYLKVAQLNLDDAYEQREIGKILGILKQYKEALKAFDRAIHLDPHFISAYIGSADALKKLGRYEDALAVLNKILKYKPQDFNLLFARAQIWKKLMRYEESNKEFKRLESLAYHEYDTEIKRPDRIKIRVVSCMFAQVNLEERAKAKERLQTAGKEISDDAIEEEIKLMMEEEKKQKELSSSQSSPLFQPVLLFMQEKQKWSGTSKQFKEAICLQSPDTFTWKAPSKFVNELEKSTLALQEEGIVVTVLPKPTVITLTRVAMKESPEMG